ncbi:hypothetical protein BZA05DRAFT_339090 [Tricharina praecox]|uniref:uncharacterized protein n=1 Tax=Tricharina praecox TaxID=43433 RepID=UPI0022206CB8|nr:uncharacterized protein BZA05DRAFT_339090 [Tricharina praecox]KAI5849681.1 hypothetical protein BZA05DRAFT_339090 [Tricharina praecox]
MGCPEGLRPTFFFASTTHARFIPTKHSFKYPLLYVGFPLTMRGSIGKVASIKASRSEKTKAEEEGRTLKEDFTFFSVDPARYINSDLPFDQKLDSVLLGHGLNPADYPLAYLVTTPAFFGYSFNPVSYYYLYSASRELKLVVLEVLNTFGEKHVYVLRSDNPTNPPARKGYLFAGTMEKVFHISSFNHRSGSYVIQVNDPIATPWNPSLDVHMAVYDKEGQKTMVARAFSHSNSFDLLTGSLFRGWYIGLTWGYNTFLSVPQAFYEAWKLYKKKATFYIRPEPLTGSIRREATRSEREMQTLFMCYLRAKVMEFRGGLEVKVTLPESTPLKMRTHPEVTFSNGKPSKGGIKQLHLRVLNPRFFMRFFATQDPSQTLWMDYTTSQPDFRLVTVEGDGGIKLFKKILERDSRQKAREAPPGWTWRLISLLRAWKTRKELRTAASGTTLPPPRTRPSSHLNTMDEFYLLQRAACPRARAMYRWKVLHAVVADVLGFGDSGNVELLASLAKSVGLIGVVVLANVAAAWHFY